MSQKVILPSLVLAACLLLLTQKSFRRRLYYGLKEIYEHRQMIIVLATLFATLLSLIYPHLNRKIRNFRKNQ